MEIEDGTYTVVYADGQYRTLRVKTVKNGGLQGKQIAGFLSGPDNESMYTFVGFVTLSGIKFWRKFSDFQSTERLERINRAFEIVSEDRFKAGEAYALRSGKCFCCSKKLTVPASLFRGLGPVCAKRAA